MSSGVQNFIAQLARKRLSPSGSTSATPPFVPIAGTTPVAPRIAEPATPPPPVLRITPPNPNTAAGSDGVAPSAATGSPRGGVVISPPSPIQQPSAGEPLFVKTFHNGGVKSTLKDAALFGLRQAGQGGLGRELGGFVGALIKPQAEHDARYRGAMQGYYADQVRADEQEQRDLARRKTEAEIENIGADNRRQAERDRFYRDDRATAAADRRNNLERQQDGEDRQAIDEFSEQFPGQPVPPELVKGSRYRPLVGKVPAPRQKSSVQRDRYWQVTDRETGKVFRYNVDTGKMDEIQGVTGATKGRGEKPDAIYGKAKSDWEQFEVKKKAVHQALSQVSKAEEAFRTAESGQESIATGDPELDALLGQLAGRSQQEKIAAVQGALQQRRDNAAALDSDMRTHLKIMRNAYGHLPGFLTVTGEESGQWPAVNLNRNALGSDPLVTGRP